MQGELSDNIDALRAEHAALVEFASAARQAIGALRSEQLRGRELPQALGHIGMIVQTSESAANDIMDAVEIILEANGLPESADKASKIVEQGNRILAACSFQDLNGQRMSLLVETMLLIEDKLGAVELVLGGHPDHDAPENSPMRDRDHLLNGPALPGEGLDQGDIDRLFSDAV